MNIMCGTCNIKTINAQQTKCVNKYKNTRLELLEVNASIWFNKQCELQFYDK